MLHCICAEMPEQSGSSCCMSQPADMVGVCTLARALRRAKGVSMAGGWGDIGS